MKLDRVTMTGPNDRTQIADLYSITGEFPFVEWGVLVSAMQEGSNRFPTQKWIRQIPEGASGFSMHLCGRWLDDLLHGKISFPMDLASRFRRMQLNFHGEDIKYDRNAFVHALAKLPIKQFIFQADGNRGTQLLAEVEDGRQSFNCYPLHDISHGAGVVPDKWPAPLADDYEGYAGGLGPNNLDQQIKKIASVVGDTRIWIDMETKVRSDDDRLFDLDKVRECLRIAQPYII